MQTESERVELVADGMLRIPEAAKFLGLSRSTVYQLMDKGDLAYVHIGSSRRIPKNSVVRLAAKNLIAVRPSMN